MHKLLLFCILTLGLYAQSSVAYLNTIRVKSGLVKLKKDKYLSNASSLHALYLMKNQTSGHYQKRGKKGFSGYSPSKRAINSNYHTLFVSENLTINTKNSIDAIDNLFSAIYHRFVFLSFDKDSIGFGSVVKKRARSVKKVYVYDLSLSGINNLCKQNFKLKNNSYYMQEICKDQSKRIPQSLYLKAKEQIQSKNNKVILFPYANQTNVPLAFYNELPDPLPRYDVSGYPISISFNPLYYNKIKFKSFKFYQNNKEIRRSKILRKSTDRNHILKYNEFALMPLERLDYNTQYKVVFKAKIDGKNFSKVWHFSTLKSKYKIYKITKQKERLKVKAGEEAILYFVPKSPRDVLKSYITRGRLKAKFIDSNTVRVTFPKRKSKARVQLISGKKKVIFDIE